MSRMDNVSEMLGVLPAEPFEAVGPEGRVNVAGFYSEDPGPGPRGRPIFIDFLSDNHFSDDFCRSNLSGGGLSTAPDY